jgi:hypothetical protein
MTIAMAASPMRLRFFIALAGNPELHLHASRA